MATCLILLLFTIFLRMTWLNKHHVAEIMGAELSKNDVQLTEETLVKMAKKIRQPMWDWHLYLGYALFVIYLFRMTLPFVGKQMPFPNPFNKKLTKGIRFKKAVYLVFYLFLLISLVTGVVIVWGPKSTKHLMEEIHELSIYYLLGFMTIHLAGIFYTEFTQDKGLISRIISGR